MVDLWTLWAKVLIIVYHNNNFIFLQFLFCWSKMASVDKVDNAPAERKANPIKSFITGGFGGICNVLSGHPLDTIKVSRCSWPYSII